MVIQNEDLLQECWYHDTQITSNGHESYSMSGLCHLLLHLAAHLDTENACFNVVVALV